MWPDGPGTPGDDPNNHAVVLVASFGQTDALFTADAESDVTGRLAAPSGRDPAGRASRIRRRRARRRAEGAAAADRGHLGRRRNDYGHPTPSTLSTLGAVPGLAVYRTDVNGRVVVESGRAAHLGADEPLTMLGCDVRRAAAAGLSPHRQRPAEASARAPPSSCALRPGGRRAALGGVDDRRRRRGCMQRARAVRRARGRTARHRRRGRTLAKEPTSRRSRRTSAIPSKERSSRSYAEGSLRGATLAGARRETRPGARLQRAEAEQPPPLGRGRVQAPRHQGRRRRLPRARRDRRRRHDWRSRTRS